MGWYSWQVAEGAYQFPNIAGEIGLQHPLRARLPPFKSTWIVLELFELA